MKKYRDVCLNTDRNLEEETLGALDADETAALEEVSVEDVMEMEEDSKDTEETEVVLTEE